MTNIEKYKILYKEIFAEELILADSDLTNNCIGALSSETNYFTFKNNFRNRLIRLYERFKDETDNLNALKNTAKEIATKTGYKWSGAYSELVALDYWQSFKDIRNIQFVCRGSVDSMPESLAKQAGQQEVDVDLRIGVHFKTLYMDVKSFIPTHYELTDRIIETVKKEIPEEKFLLSVQNLGGGDYLTIIKDIPEELKTGHLKKEIIQSIKNKKAYLNYKANSGQDYQFRISYSNEDGKIIHFTEDSFEPYRAANKNKYKALEYYNKLFKNEGSLLIFVLNPWFNREMIGDLGGSNQTFYRAFCRRVFIEFNRDNRDLSDYFESISHSITVKEISNCISGIIFIEDLSITKDSQDIYNSYIYLNPNATNNKLSHSDFEVLSWGKKGFQPNYIDDFSNDNY